MKDNPYQTPESDLTTEKVQLPKTLWWKIFFFIGVIFMLIGIPAVVFFEEMTFGLWESIDMLISIISMVGLFGLAFNKAIGKQAFWQYFFYISLLVSIAFSILFPLFGIEFYGQVQELNIEYAIGIIVGLIFVWASYLYGFKRPQIWNRILD